MENDLVIRKCKDCEKVWEDIPPVFSCPECNSENIEEATAEEL